MEKSVDNAGDKVLSTTPYFPDLHPIELYWSEGKGNVSRNYYFSHSFKSIVSDLRDGWYGNMHRTLNGKMDLQFPEDEDPNFVIEVKNVDFSR